MMILRWMIYAEHQKCETLISASHLPPTFYRLLDQLHTAYQEPPTAYRLQPTAYCPLHTASLLSNKLLGGKLNVGTVPTFKS